MTNQSKLSTVYGFDNPLQAVNPLPIISTRTPTTADISFPLGQTWVDKALNKSYVLTSVVSGSANWETSGGAGVETVVSDSGSAVPSGTGSLSIVGGSAMSTSATGNTLTIAAATATTALKGVVELALDSEAVTGTANNLAVTPANLTAWGAAPSTAIGITTPVAAFLSSVRTPSISTGAGNSLTVTLGDSLGVNKFIVKNLTGATVFDINSDGAVVIAKSVQVTSANAGIRIREGGAGASNGRATLAAGSVVVATTYVSTNSRIFVTHKTPGGALGFLSVTAVADGVSFTITSSSGTDTSEVSWLIIKNP